MFFTKLSEIERVIDFFWQISLKREDRLLILLHEWESDKNKIVIFYNPIKNTLFFLLSMEYQIFLKWFANH